MYDLLQKITFKNHFKVNLLKTENMSDENSANKDHSAKDRNNIGKDTLNQKRELVFHHNKILRQLARY